MSVGIIVIGIVDWTIKLSEFQIHSLILACFTSLVSPFGGFFASGFKRAIKIKVYFVKLSELTVIRTLLMLFQDMEVSLIEWTAKS